MSGVCPVNASNGVTFTASFNSSNSPRHLLILWISIHYLTQQHLVPICASMQCIRFPVFLQPWCKWSLIQLHKLVHFKLHCAVWSMLHLHHHCLNIPPCIVKCDKFDPCSFATEPCWCHSALLAGFLWPFVSCDQMIARCNQMITLFLKVWKSGKEGLNLNLSFGDSDTCVFNSFFDKIECEWIIHSLLE